MGLLLSIMIITAIADDGGAVWCEQRATVNWCGVFIFGIPGMH